MTLMDELRAMLGKARRYIESAEALCVRGLRFSSISPLLRHVLLRRGPAAGKRLDLLQP